MANISASFRQAALRRGLLIGPDRVDTQATEAVSYAAVVEFANLGFVVDPKELRGLPVEFLEASLAEARKVIGADREMTPIYPGFPKQVEELSTLTLLVEQILHYWTSGAFIPSYPTVAREGLPLEDMLRNARRLSVVSADEAAEKLIGSLVSSPVALSEADIELLTGAIPIHFTHAHLAARSAKLLKSIVDLSKSASNGENLQTFIRALIAEIDGGSGISKDDIFAIAAYRVPSVDHLLRLILAVYTVPAAEKWAGNYELAVGTLADRHSRAVRYLNIPRAQRRTILKGLGDLTSGFYADRLLTRRDLWRGVLRTIHAYDLKPSVAERRAADIISSNGDYRTLNSLVEEALEKRETGLAADLLAEHQPGNLLRRLVAILRLTSTQADADSLAAAVAKSAPKAALSTLISAYNGVLSANDDSARVTRVAGLTNTMVDRGQVAKVDANYQAAVLEAVDSAIVASLRAKPAPSGPVAIESSTAVPLVRRDASTADRVIDRGEEIGLAGEGDVLRIFGHWINNQSGSGYMDIGAVVLDGNFEKIAVTTWDAWANAREWSTYSGDKLVEPGDSASEFIDVKLSMLKELFPSAEWVAMTVQSWSGWPIKDVDFIAGAMLRSNADAGSTFDARSVTTAFKPTTASTQAVPFAVNLESGKLIWVDSSNGSTSRGLSSTEDESIGAIVYDELARPRLTIGQLAALWASAHGVSTVDEPADRDQILGLL